MFRKLCGESTLKNVVLVTNMWSEDPDNVNEAREKELSSKFFKPTLDKGAQMVRHHNTTESAHDILRKIMDNHPVALQIQQELVDEGKDIIDTAAGESIKQELQELIMKHQAELNELRGAMLQALKDKDKEMRRELEETKRSLLEKIEEIEEAVERMATNYAAERESMKVKMREMEQGAKRDMERAKADYDQKVAILQGAAGANRLRGKRR